MKHLYPRLMIAAPKSGSGKTMMTCGLLNGFLARNIACRAFKCGPDYIDPMFHKVVLGIDGGNLDTFFMEKEQVKDQLINQAENVGLSIIEGVMGYYDGVGGDSTWGSSYEVACAVDAPVVMILDCKGASLSLAAVMKGFLEYKENSHICGVILNRTTELMANRLKPAMEELGIKMYGYLPECEEGRLDSRHLGLVLPGELKGLKEQLDRLAVKMESTIDMEGLVQLARNANPLSPSGIRMEQNTDPKSDKTKVPIGIAKDEAFCFYYQENLRLLEELGAELIPFSPIHDKRLPSGICGLIFGGGYPELYGPELSENVTMLREIREAQKRSMPILAECGGFLYLHEELETKEHKVYPMAGIIKGRGFPKERLLRFGYIEAFSKEDTAFLNDGESIRGHEFHYWDSTNSGIQLKAQKPGGKRSWDCVHASGNLMAGFPHFYYLSNPVFAKKYVEACKNMKDIEIVPGSVRDIEEIAALYDTVNEYLESHINYPGWRKGKYPTRIDAEQGVGEGKLYIARLADRIIGSVIVNQEQELGYDSITWKTSADPGEVAVIHTFLVHPDCLNMGIGRILLEFAENKAEEEGRKVIRLDVYEKNDPAIRLYERMGYQYMGTADLGFGDYGLDWFKLYEKPLNK